MADFNIADLIAAAGQQSALINSTNSKLSAISDQTGTLADSIVAAMSTGTDGRGNTALSAQTELLGKLDAQQRKQEFRAAIGDDPTTAAMISTQLASTYTQALQKGLQQQQAVAEKEQVGLFDNPIQFLWNQVTLPDERNAANATLGVAKTAATGLQTVNTLMDERSKLENEYAITLSKASIDSQVQGIKSDITARAAQTSMQALQSQAHMLSTVMQAGEVQVQNITQVLSAKNQAAHLAISQGEYAMQKQKFNEWMTENQEKKEFASQLTSWYNAGASTVGREPLTTDKVQLLLKSGGSIAKEAAAYIEAGYNSLSAKTQKLGNTPSYVAEFLETTRNTVPSSAEYAGKIFQAGRDAVRNEVSAGRLKENNKEGAAQLFDKAVYAKLAEYQNGIKYSDASNPYILPPPSILKESPDIAQSSLFTKVIAPNNIPDSDPNKIISAGIQAYLEGKISYRDFSNGVGLYYSKGMLANNVFRQFDKFGMPTQTKYIASLKVPSGMSSDVASWNPFSSYTDIKVDLTDPVARNNFLTRRIAAEMPAGIKFKVGVPTNE